MDTTKLLNKKSVGVINLVSDCSHGSPITIVTSNNTNTFMNTPSTNQHNSPARTNKKIGEIIQKITNSPTKRTDTDSEQLIAIIPASSSTPNGKTYTNTPQQDNTEQTHSPEERQITNAIHENIHMGEGQADDVSAMSTISSLNTADIEALDKIFD